MLCCSERRRRRVPRHVLLGCLGSGPLRWCFWFVFMSVAHNLSLPRGYSVGCGCMCSTSILLQQSLPHALSMAFLHCTVLSVPPPLSPRWSPPTHTQRFTCYHNHSSATCSVHTPVCSVVWCDMVHNHNHLCSRQPRRQQADGRTFLCVVQLNPSAKRRNTMTASWRTLKKFRCTRWKSSALKCLGRCAAS